MNNIRNVSGKENRLLADKILDNIPGNVFIYDIPTEKLIYLRSISDEHLALPSEALLSYGGEIGEQLLHPDDRIVIGQFLEELNYLSEGSVKDLEIRIKNRSGKYCWFEIKLSICSRDDSGKATQVIGLFQNINESKITKEALELSELSYRKLFNTIEDAIYIQDETGTFIDVNDGAINMYGYNRNEFIGKTPQFLSAEGKNNFDLLKERLAEAFKGKNQNFEFWGKKKNGEIFLKDVKVQRGIYFGQNVLIAIARDITKRKQAEEKIKAALAEKNVLLREVHHRVKNNLQAMIYLIEMQSERLEDKKVQIFLRELQEQARTMSLVYEQLYQSDFLSEVDMDKYLNKLTSNVIQTFRVGKDIKYKVNTKNALLNVEVAMPCGLIVNELLTNSLKYAFTENFTKQPIIEISLKKENQEIEIIVSDNGVGLPENFDWENSESLGLKLVNFWVKYQLAGTININQEQGTKYVIIFTYEEK
jgi:PAS domain S-box-containing protein